MINANFNYVVVLGNLAGILNKSEKLKRKNERDHTVHLQSSVHGATLAVLFCDNNTKHDARHPPHTHTSPLLLP